MILAAPVASLAIAAWPARVVVAAPGQSTIHVDNPGAEPVGLDATPSGYALDLRGRPRLLAARAPGAWLAVRPAHLVVPARSTKAVSVTVNRPRGARPGDHALVVLLTTRPPSVRTVLARVRIGVVVVVRVPGALLHRLTVGGVRVQRRGRRALIEVSVANHGNLDEWIARRRLQVRLVRRGRLVTTLSVEPRRLLAGTRGLVEARYAGRARGRVTAVVTLTAPRAGVPLLRRAFPLRL
jgi:hypothetical protein